MRIIRSSIVEELAVALDTPDIVSRPEHAISFEVNGERFTRADADITVRGMLALVSVPPAENRIIELKGDEQVVYLDLDAKITLTSGARFETIRVYEYCLGTERQVSVADHLTVREILSNAALDPNEHYLIEMRGNEQIEYKDLDRTLKLRGHEKFIPIYHGSTPVS